jgi:ATP-binding cassette subfamily B protein
MFKQFRTGFGRLSFDGRRPVSAVPSDGIGTGVDNAAHSANSVDIAGTLESGLRSYHGRYVTIYLPENAVANDETPTLLRDAEQILDELERMLSPDAAQVHTSVALYVIDSASLEMDSDTMWSGFNVADSEAIRLLLPPNAPLSTLAITLTSAFIERNFGADAIAAQGVVAGIAGLAAARRQLGPTIEEADRWVRTAIHAGGIGALSARLIENRTAGSDAGAYSSAARRPDRDDLAATSFVAFLIAKYGTAALRTYLQTYDPTRQDIAANNAYQHPLGVLVENWINELQHRHGSKDAFRALLPRLLPLLRPYRAMQVEILCCLALAATCNVATPLVVKYFLKDFQEFFKQGGLTRAAAALYFNSTVLRFIGALACIYVLSALVSLRRTDSVNRLNQSVLNSLQLKMFAHLQRLPHGFYARARLGDLMTCLTGDLDNIQSALSQLTNKSLYQVFMLIGGCIGLFLTTGFSVLTLLILLIIPLFALAYAGLRARNKAASREQRKQVGQTAAAAQEYLSAHAVIKAYGLEERVITAFDSSIQAQRRSKLRLARLGVLTDLSEDLATALAQLVILGVGGYLVLLHHEMHIHMEDLVASLLLVKYIIGPVASLSGIGQTLQQASGSMDRVSELFDEPVTIADRPGAADRLPLSREIRLERVEFGYEDNLPVLLDLSLVIPAGTHAAIVGPTGCGKSTVLNLLMRFWDPHDGSILFDGQDLRDVTVSSHRGQIGLVFQDTFIFDTTVRENIGIGQPQATDADIMAAAKAARLDEDIQAMPSGYDTVLGERGVRMSGGQRQRLAIARAILRNPTVLLLDEATSALDAQTETGILETIAALKHGRTVISVTHRLSWAKEADLIFVLEKGRLVEQGAHAELVTADGLYQKLYQEQMGSIQAVGSGQ